MTMVCIGAFGLLGVDLPWFCGFAALRLGISGSKFKDCWHHRCPKLSTTQRQAPHGQGFTILEAYTSGDGILHLPDIL